MTELLDIFKWLPTAPEDALSTVELSEESGMSESAISVKLRQLHREGRLEVGRKPIIRRDGVKGWVPAYWLIEPN